MIARQRRHQTRCSSKFNISRHMSAIVHKGKIVSTNSAAENTLFQMYDNLKLRKEQGRSWQSWSQQCGTCNALTERIVRVYLQEICGLERNKCQNLEREIQHPFRAFQAAAMLHLLTSAYAPAASPTHLLSKQAYRAFVVTPGLSLQKLINVNDGVSKNKGCPEKGMESRSSAKQSGHTLGHQLKALYRQVHSR